MRNIFRGKKTGKNFYGRCHPFIVIAATLFCLAAASITTMRPYNHDTTQREGSAYTIARQIQYSFTLQNTSRQVIEKADLWTFAPVKHTAHQRCLNIQSNYPYKVFIDDSGNQVLHFTFENMAPYGSRIVTINADLLVSVKGNPVSSEPLPWNFNPQKYIESDHPEIKRVAQKLNSPDSLKTIEEVFRWVAGNLRYSGYVGKNRGALFALEHKAGDCTEYANLFVALCRANDIAARSVGGYVCPQNGVLNARNYHNWSEFYDQGTWKLADPQNRVLMQNAADYIAMRIIHASEEDPMGSYNRFRFKGEGLKVRMN